jgi:hypothetical protein
MTRSTTEPSNDAQVDAAIAEYLESVDRGEQVDVREFLGAMATWRRRSKSF